MKILRYIVAPTATDERIVMLREENERLHMSHVKIREEVKTLHAQVRGLCNANNRLRQETKTKP